MKWIFGVFEWLAALQHNAIYVDEDTTVGSACLLGYKAFVVLRHFQLFVLWFFKLNVKIW